jgi:hypothetical protein
MLGELRCCLEGYEGKIRENTLEDKMTFVI